jgi:hypothetical protein
MMPMANVPVFPASNAEVALAEAALSQAKFYGLASQFFFRFLCLCLQGTTQCPPASCMFYSQPFKGKPGASRGRKASGL